MLQHASQREREGFGQLEHRHVAFRETIDDPAAVGVAEGVKNLVELTIEHGRQLTPGAREGQPGISERLLHYVRGRL